MPPAQVADIVFDAIQEERFYIYTHPAFLERVRTRMEGILEGTLPEPAVSVPRAKLTNPVATATAEPELEPPEMWSGLNGFRQTPNGLRSPARPVAN